LKTRKQLQFILCRVNVKKNSALWQHPKTYISLQEMQVQIILFTYFLFCWDQCWFFCLFLY